MSNVQAYLQQTVDGFEKLGHPALMQRFVLKHGKPFVAMPFIGKRGIIKMCYKNAMELCYRHLNDGICYVEGYALRPSIGFPMEHAWCVDKETGVVLDPTWDDPEECEYYGVIISMQKAMDTILETGVYGVLDSGTRLNTKFMFEVDPSLARVVENFRKKERV
jgi:hypothetical protein